MFTGGRTGPDGHPENTRCKRAMKKKLAETTSGGGGTPRRKGRGGTKKKSSRKRGVGRSRQRHTRTGARPIRGGSRPEKKTRNGNAGSSGGKHTKPKDRTAQKGKVGRRHPCLFSTALRPQTTVAQKKGPKKKNERDARAGRRGVETLRTRQSPLQAVK